MQRRSQVERYLAILGSLANAEEQRAYHIACNARLKWVELAKDLESLTSLGLVRSNAKASGVYYSLTPSGVQTFEKYRSAVTAFYPKEPLAAESSRS